MSTREAVLAALARCRGDGPERRGARAQSLGVSRVAIGKHVASLREAGYEIEAEPGVGYRLIAVPGRPAARRDRAASPGRVLDACSPAGERPPRRTTTPGRWRAKARPRAPWCSRRHRAAGRGRLGRDVGVAGRRRVPLDRAAADSHAGRAGAARARRRVSGVARGLAGALRRGGIAQVAQRRPARRRQARGRPARDVCRDRSRELGRRRAWGSTCAGTTTARQAPGAACLDDVVPGVRIAHAVAAVLDGIAERLRAVDRIGVPGAASGVRGALVADRAGRDRARHDRRGASVRNRDGCRRRGPAADRRRSAAWSRWLPARSRCESPAHRTSA